MVENETLIEKLGKHPRIWGCIALAAALCCIVIGILGLMPIKKVPVEEAEGSPVGFAKAEGILVRCDFESFEIRNTFCRYLPTGVQYFYLAYTEDRQPIFIRAGKNWASDFEDGAYVDFCGAVNSFNNREKAYIKEEYAMEAETFVDLIYVRLNILLIVIGALLLTEIALGAVLIKDKIPAESVGYKFMNVVFCTLIVVIAALGIHLVGFV